MKQLRVRIYGSDGVELSIGDLVRVFKSGSRGGTVFYTRVVLDKGRLYPMYYFSYDRIEKIDAIPETAFICDDDTIKPPAEIWAEGKMMDDEERDTKWILESIEMCEGKSFYRVEEVQSEATLFS